MANMLDCDMVVNVFNVLINIADKGEKEWMKSHIYKSKICLSLNWAKSLQKNESSK